MTTNLTPTENEVEVMNHLKAMADKSIAWANEAPETRWCATEIYTLEHIRSMGYTSVAVMERKHLEIAVYETTRSMYGYKPSWQGLVNSTTEELQADLDRMSNRIKAEYDEEAAYKTAHPYWSKWEQEEYSLKEQEYYNFYSRKDQEEK